MRRFLGSAAAALLLPALATSGAVAQEAELSPDTVVTVFDSDTLPGFGAVGGVATDALGYVYVADFRNAVWRLSPDGEVELFAEGFYGASGNAIGPQGHLFQSSFHGNYVARVTRTGHWQVWADEGLSGPVGIAAAPDGTLYVCNCSADNLVRIDAEGRVSVFSESELFACPNGITLDDRGDLYVVNFNNPHVVRVGQDGTATSLTQVTGAGGNGHVTFARGGLYVTQFRGNRVFRVERDGSQRLLAGTGQPGTADGAAPEATFTRPNGIAAAPGGQVLWVNDLTEGQGLGRGRSRVHLRRIRLVTMQDVLAAVEPGAGPDAVRVAYEAYRAARPGEHTAADAIAQAFAFMSTGRFPDGFAILQMNAASYPGDANSQYQLGEGFRYAGRAEDAARQYERALELDPDHAQARARLELVRGG